MNCAVGSRENTPSRPLLTDIGRAANGRIIATFLAGAFLASASVGLAQAQGTAAPAAAPAKTPAAAPAKTPASSTTAPAAKKPAAAKGAAGAAEKSSPSYAIGVSVGSELKRTGVPADEISAQAVAAGLRDALSGKTEMSAEYQQTIMGMMRKAHEAQVAARAKEAEPNHAKATAFLTENGKKKDVVTTASGLEYKVVNAGAGEAPKPGDLVTVNYRGTLLDGTEFDSSAKHGGPATFPSNGVIKGWQEALALMKPGAKYQLWIPPQLAYDVESPPSIPPGSMLVFDVDLVSVKPAGAPSDAAHPQIQPAQPAQPSAKK